MVYLDYNASTPIDPDVIETMEPFIKHQFGNPSTNYNLGKKAKEAVENARKQVAGLLNCTPDEIIFTSGGSESNNTVIKGAANLLRKKGNHIITSQIEHPSVLTVCKYLEQNGFTVTYLPVDEYGMVIIEELKKAMNPKTILVTIMHANNETGTIQPIKEIAKICHANGTLLHTDAAQSIGKVNVDINDLDVDFLTLAGHKLYAPKGIGVLYVKNGVPYEPLIHGASHENGKRAGTENVIFNVGLGKACEIAYDHLQNKDTTIQDLTNYLYNQLVSIFSDKIKLNGHPTYRLPNTLNISFLDYNAHSIVEKLDEVAVSTGSACHSGLTSLSPVLKAMNLDHLTGSGAIRFSLGRFTTKEEINTVIEQLKLIIK
ncbi:cysteine desulfurase family protein [Haloplasma contractile]|uniref:cysteine desulfurase n=1 Tax=Haloplasma contractile SSD-17B TaxID=1033810 RepID=F7PW45_9MOLU|nr:cysteine desulfurase family protein [Haloplasma contractile]ERJ12718.1 cysteine desulfurase protein [Haloplasma contractile SSD-17B]